MQIAQNPAYVPGKTPTEKPVSPWASPLAGRTTSMFSGVASPQKNRAPTQLPTARFSPAPMAARPNYPIGNPMASTAETSQAATGAPGAGINAAASIQPQGVFSSPATQQAKNQAVSDAFTNSSPFSAMKMRDTPGLSRGVGSQRLAAPTIAGGYADAAHAATMIPYQDQMTNLQSDLQGQVARDNEGIGWAGLGQQMTDYSNQRDVNNKRSSLSLLQALMGGF